MCNGRPPVPTASLWKRVRPRFTSLMGRMHDADRLWEHAGQRAEQQHLPDAAGGIYAVKALHDALVSNCSAARDSAHTWTGARPFGGDRSRRGAGFGAMRRNRPRPQGNGTIGRGGAQQHPGQRNLPARSEGRSRPSAAPSGTGRGAVVSGRSLLAGDQGSASSRPSIVRDEKSAAGRNRLRAGNPVSSSGVWARERPVRRRLPTTLSACWERPAPRPRPTVRRPDGATNNCSRSGRMPTPISSPRRKPGASRRLWRLKRTESDA